MNEKTTLRYSAINIRMADKPRFDNLILRNGLSAVRFMTDVINEKSCAHPVGKRVALSVTYMKNGEAFNTENLHQVMAMHGYFCKKCRRAIIPEPIL